MTMTYRDATHTNRTLTSKKIVYRSVRVLIEVQCNAML